MTLAGIKLLLFSFNSDEWLGHGALMKRAALDPIVEIALQTLNELMRSLLAAHDALSQAAAATFEWCTDCVWREPLSPTTATIPTPIPPAPEAGQAKAADVSSCKSSPFGGTLAREPCTFLRR